MIDPLPPSVVGGQIDVLTVELRLPTVRKVYRRVAREMAQQGGDYEAYLLSILREEADDRAARRVQRRIKEARFPQVKLLSDLDHSAKAIPPAAQLAELAKGDYIREGRNVIALGGPGTGKTHVATGLAVEACRQGWRVRFWPVATLAAELQAAAEEHTLHRFLSRFASWDLVVLDELGYIPLTKAAAELLFQAVSARHECRSLAITSNLAFPDWTEVFQTERLTMALLDRVTDRATILQMNGPSFRLAQTLAAKARGDSGNTAEEAP